MILFKDPNMQRDFAKIDPSLRAVIAYMESYAYGHWYDDLVVTSIYRDQEGSTHKYWRAVDIAILEHGESEQLRTSVNTRFPYDLARPEYQTIPKLRHGTAPHFHIQVRQKLEEEA